MNMVWELGGRQVGRPGCARYRVNEVYIGVIARERSDRGNPLRSPGLQGIATPVCGLVRNDRRTEGIATPV